MHIQILTMSFSLPGCLSLKEKRQRIGSIHERYERQPAVADCESCDRARLAASEWSFVVLGNAAHEAEALCREIEERLQRTVDARVMAAVRDRLCCASRRCLPPSLVQHHTEPAVDHPLAVEGHGVGIRLQARVVHDLFHSPVPHLAGGPFDPGEYHGFIRRSEEPRLNSSHVRISYAVFC